MLRRRVAPSALAASCILAAAVLGGGTASAAERAFELVTPPDSLAEIETVGSFASRSGDLVVFSSVDSLPGSIPNGPAPTLDGYTARRGPGGWSTEWTTDSSDEPGSFGSMTIFSSEDGLRQIMQTENSIDPGDTFAHSNDPYERLRAADGSRTLTWLAPGPRSGVDSRMAVAVTPDLETVLFEATSPLVPEDTDQTADLYLARDGALTLVTPNTTASAVAQRAARRAVPGSFGEDGSYAYFTTTSRALPEDIDNAADVYRWNDDGTVTLVSGNAVAGTNFPVTLISASRDGDRACFTTRARLLAADVDTADDVYCRTHSSGTLEMLTTGIEQDLAVAATGLAVSEDGGSVFFATAARLTGEDEDGGLSLYVNLGGDVRYVSMLDASDTQPRRAASTNQSQRSLRSNGDGTAVIFTTAARAVGDDTDTQPDVYRWTATGGLQQLSAGNGSGSAWIGARSSLPHGVFDEEAVSGRAWTDDTRTVFFESTDALVTADTDGGFVDVYEWSEDGGVRLISPPGEARYDALYVDNSADGSTVFLITAEPVLEQDVNATRDLYAARVGGGFPVATPVPPCSGDSCQGILVPGPSLPTVGSDGFQGNGDDEEAEPVDTRVTLLRLSSRQRRAFARTGKTTVRVRVSARGMVAATVSARIGRRTARVGQAWRNASKRGVVRITVQLSQRARAELRRRGRLRVTIAASHASGDETARQVVVLRG